MKDVQSRSAHAPTRVQRIRKNLVLLLSCAAGAIDAASYIGLGHVFAANMTGNTVHLGMAVGYASAADISRSGAALVGFVLGVAVGASIVERDDSAAPWPRAVNAALLCEVILLAAAAAIWHAASPTTLATMGFLLLALGVAMGMQSVTVRRLRIPGVASTFLTGTLTSLTAGLVRRVSGRRTSTPEAPTHGTLLMTLVWLIYAAGAAITTVSAPRGGAASLILPMALIATVLVAADRDSIWAPRAIADE